MHLPTRPGFELGVVWAIAIPLAQTAPGSNPGLSRFAPTLRGCNSEALGVKKYILRFLKPPIFMYLVVAGHGHIYILNTQKAFLKMTSFITVSLLRGCMSNFAQFICQFGIFSTLKH